MPNTTEVSGRFPSISHPEKFNFLNPGSWPQWRKRFERYMSVSGQDKKTSEEKIDLLLYIMGEDSEDILVQFSPTPTTYDEMMTKFENHFVPRQNVIFERFKFNSRRQLPGESVDTFIVACIHWQTHVNTRHLTRVKRFETELLRECRTRRRLII